MKKVLLTVCIALIIATMTITALTTAITGKVLSSRVTPNSDKFELTTMNTDLFMEKMRWQSWEKECIGWVIIKTDTCFT